MFISNLGQIPGYEISENLGVIRANSIRAKWFGKDILVFLRSLAGGELREYKELMNETREKALNDLKDDAKALGADAILCLRFEGLAISNGAAEILVYGTAVKLKKK